VDQLKLSGVVLDAPDAGALAAFYRRLLGWEVEQDEPGWVKLRSRDGGAGLSFQTEAQYVRPVWPAGRGEPQMQVHLDIAVEDLAAAGKHAIAAGAALAEYQPQDDVRVYLDPAGHPFCLFLPPEGVSPSWRVDPVVRPWRAPGGRWRAAARR
jgi:catechol 2,3-dioxygenase-like lactoylglutathione lyase family enzyme